MYASPKLLISWDPVLDVVCSLALLGVVAYCLYFLFTRGIRVALLKEPKKEYTYDEEHE